MILSRLRFPLFIVFQQANSFMLSAYLSVEWLASHLETALVIHSLTLSAAVSGCRVPRCTRSSWQPSLRVFYNAAHALARSWSCWTNFRLGRYPSNYLYGSSSRSCRISWAFSEMLCWHIGYPDLSGASILLQVSCETMPSLAHL